MKRRLYHIIKEDNFLSLAGNIMIALFGLAGFGLLARHLSSPEFGQWVLFIAGGSLVDMLRFGITNTGLVRFLSGADEIERKKLAGSNVLIGFTGTAIVAVLMVVINYFFHHAIQHSGYGLFFTWYPLLALFNLSWNNASVILQAERRYGKILLLKSINSAGFFIVLVINSFTQLLDLQGLAIALLVVNALTSLTSLIAGWDGTRYTRKADRQTTKLLLHFGKYTTFTLVGTNLLRSADTIIIGLSPLGNAAVALYSIPLKLTELQQIPLRSFAATAFPKMASASLKGKKEEVRELFYVYAGAMSFLFILGAVITFVFAGPFVMILGGSRYMGVDPVIGCSAVSIVRIFSLYGLLLPIDRMTGIALDSINKPHVNALKVLYMLIANIIGDVVAIFIFHSLLLVAVASIIFTVVGIYVGLYFLQSSLQLEWKAIFSRGWNFYREQANKLFQKQASTQAI